MKKLILCVHNHQPLGNFSEVFQRAYRQAYLPFLETLSAYPEVKVALHVSGPVYEYLLENNLNHYLDLMRELIGRGQLEVLSGGFYEPILSLIPEEDVIAQVKLMNDFLKATFNYQPRGLWLAERVWETNLVRPLSRAGMEYTLIDDHGFYMLGLKEEELGGYFITEDEGYTLKLFPILKSLRRMIPAREPEEVLAFIRNAPGPAEVFVYGDDGEKFGLWPGTHDRLYREGWLRRFLNLLSNEKDVETALPSEVLDAVPPRDRVYLPPSSYEEMEEWSLPPEEQVELRKKKAAMDQESRRFLRGGYFKNFLVKYAESNRMHKRMLFLRERLGDERGKAFRHYLRGQCNCAYWHGVFGGLYFPFLREAVYREFLQAESELQTPESFQRLDFDKDGLEEMVFLGQPFNLFFHRKGGRVLEWDDRPSLTNLSNVMTRYIEAYHLDKGQRATPGNSSSHLSEAQKEPVFDRYTRENFLDHFLESPEDWERSFPNLSLYQAEISSPFTLSLRGEGIPLKEFTVKGNELLLSLEVEKRKPYYMLELNLACFMDWRPPSERGRSLTVPFPGPVLHFELSQEALFRAQTIFTISSSQAGLERNYQGMGIYLIFPLKEERNRMDISIRRE